MNTYSRTREVEVIVPFADRALTAIARLRALQEGLLSLDLAGREGAWTTPMLTLQKAIDLLNEARHRGVKGKDLGR
jgi:hypothetical protein